MIVAAVAIVVQMVILAAIYIFMKESSTRMEKLFSRLEERYTPLLTTAQTILTDAQPKLSEITTNLAETSVLIRAHVAQVGEATGEIAERARLQAARLDDMVTNAVERIEETTSVVQNTVINPIRRIQAIIQAVSAGVGFLRSVRNRHRSNAAVNEADDEEMFI